MVCIVPRTLILTDSLFSSTSLRTFLDIQKKEINSENKEINDPFTEAWNTM